MYDGYQVLRFENNYKSKDLYLIGNEMNNRVGTGNYDKERTKFNYSYVPLAMPSLKTQVYTKLREQNIYYNEGKVNEGGDVVIAYEDYPNNDRMFVGTNKATSQKISITGNDEQGNIVPNQFIETYIYNSEPDIPED